MALHLCRPKHRSLSNPSLFHLFSTSQNDNNNSDVNDNDSSQSSRNSYFRDVKDRLRKSRRDPSKGMEVEDIKRSLAQFQLRSAAPSHTETNSTASQSQHVSFQELYRRNTNNEGSGKLPFEEIRNSLRQLGSKNSNKASRSNVGNSGDLLSLAAFKNSFKLKPQGENSNTVIDGTHELPDSVFGKEMRAKGRIGEREDMKTEFVRTYSLDELGEKLRKLRPEGLEGGFSLRELNERLMRVREMDEKKELQISGVSSKDLRESLINLMTYEEAKGNKSSSEYSSVILFWLLYCMDCRENDILCLFLIVENFRD